VVVRGAVGTNFVRYAKYARIVPVRSADAVILSALGHDRFQSTFQ
jgi:hypothetical protein